MNTPGRVFSGYAEVTTKGAEAPFKVHPYQYYDAVEGAGPLTRRSYQGNGPAVNSGPVRMGATIARRRVPLSLVSQIIASMVD